MAIFGAIAVMVPLGLLSKYLKGLGYYFIGNVFSLSIVVVTIIGVVLFNRKYNGLKPKKYGFHFNRIWGHCLQAFSIVTLIIAIVLYVANTLFDIPIDWMWLHDNYGKPLILSLVATLAIAIWEEVFFRGLIFTTLYNNKFDFHQSALISSLLFSVLHWSSFDMQIISWFWYLGITIIGYILVLLYVHTNSIWTPIFFHFFWNFFVELMEDGENKIGLYSIPNYDQYGKSVDNIEVFFLGMALVAIWKFRQNLTCFFS